MNRWVALGIASSVPFVMAAWVAAQSTTRPAVWGPQRISPGGPVLLTAQPSTRPAMGGRQAGLEAKLVELEHRVAALEAQLARMTSTSPDIGQPQASAVLSANVGEAPLVLDDWDYRCQEGDYGRWYYSIVLKLRNTGAKQIKLVDASVRFTDLLNESLYGIKITPDISIAPGKTYIDKGDYGINQFMNEQLRMKDMKKADIKATLKIRRIVFSDNTILQIE